MGLTNGGLGPTFSEKIGQKSVLDNWGLSGLIGAFSGSIGAFSAPHKGGEAAEIPPKGLLLARSEPFGPSPRLLRPHLGFPVAAETEGYKRSGLG